MIIKSVNKIFSTIAWLNFQFLIRNVSYPQQNRKWYFWIWLKPSKWFESSRNTIRQKKIWKIRKKADSILKSNFKMWVFIYFLFRHSLASLEKQRLRRILKKTPLINYPEANLGHLIHLKTFINVLCVFWEFWYILKKKKKKIPFQLITVMALKFIWYCKSKNSSKDKY